MITDPNYETRTLLAPFEQGPVVPTFLRDTFFQGREYPATNLIEFDYRRGRRKMAPFVAPLIGGKVMERQGFETHYFRAPRIAPVRNLRVPDLEPRMFGETIYQGGTAADRAAQLIAEDAVFCDEAISRREEWMCREVLIHGKLTITADHGYVMIVDFMQEAAGALSNQFTPAPQWNDAAALPLQDLEAARLLTIKESGISPDIALFGNDAKNAFVNNASVQKLLDVRRFELGNVAPRIDSNEIVRFATIPGIECYSYAEYFEDDAGALFPMLPTNAVLLLSSNSGNKIVYGAFTQLEDVRQKRFVTYQTARIPYVYGDEENGHLFYRLTSCPLPMPSDVLGWRVILALPGALTTEAPFFANMQVKTGPGAPEAQEEIERAVERGETGGAVGSTIGKTVETVQGPVPDHRGTIVDRSETKADLEEHTVEELRDIAEREQVEIESGDRKADIIKAIQKSRKNKS
jgi:hypothetical protein